MAQATRPLRKSAVAVVGGGLALPSTTSALVGVERNPLLRLWKAYTDSLSRQPLLTKACMAAIIFFSSDSATQYLLRHQHQHDSSQQQDDSSSTPTAATSESFQWDPVRALSGASFGVIATTWLHYWWGFLEVAVASRLPVAQYRLANTAVKVVIDQAIGAPLYIYSYYCITNVAAAVQQQTFASSSAVSQQQQDSTFSSLTDLLSVAARDVHTKASEMLLPTMRQHWKLWPAVHLCNFYFVPLQHRVLVQNTVLVGWSGYLSHLNHQSKLMTPDEEINVVLARRETELKLQTSRQQQLPTATSSQAARSERSPEGVSNKAV